MPKTGITAGGRAGGRLGTPPPLAAAAWALPPPAGPAAPLSAACFSPVSPASRLPGVERCFECLERAEGRVPTTSRCWGSTAELLHRRNDQGSVKAPGARFRLSDIRQLTLASRHPAMKRLAPPERFRTKPGQSEDSICASRSSPVQRRQPPQPNLLYRCPGGLQLFQDAAACREGPPRPDGNAARHLGCRHTPGHCEPPP